MKNEKPRLMIVDDDVGLTLLMKMNLELDGHFEVEIVNRSPEAAETALSYQPDLILLDYKMPEMNGAEVIDHFRKDSKLSGIPVIMVSASLSPDGLDKDGIPLCSGRPLLCKPVDLSELKRAADLILARPLKDRVPIAV